MICLASFALQMIVFGVHYSFGVLFVLLREDFETGSGATAWVHSIMAAMTFLVSKYEPHRSLYVKCPY